MFKLRLHKWLLCFALLASLVSFSGHTNGFKISIATTELVLSDTFKVDDEYFYLDHFRKVYLEITHLSFFRFNFHSFLKTKNRKYISQLFNQDLEFITFKNKFLILFSTYGILTSTKACFF